MAYDQSLGATHISSNLASYEAARSGFFTLIVNDIDNLIKPTYAGEAEDATDADRIQRAQEYLKLNILKSSVPSFTLQKKQYRRGNEYINFVGTPEWKDSSITVDDVVGLDTKDILYAWEYLAFNPHTHKGGRMADYKKDCTLCEYTQDYQLIRQWTLYGCFITSIEESEFDKENDDKRKLNATIVYDRAVMDDISEVNA